MFIKQIQRISDGSGVYLDKKILKHMGVQRGDLLRIKLIIDPDTNEPIAVMQKHKDLLDEDTLNDLLMRVEIDEKLYNI